MMLNELITTPMALAMGWSLLHFLWQGTLIAGATWLTLLLIHLKRSNLRYAVACSGLFLMLMCPLVTTTWLLSNPGSAVAVNRSAVEAVVIAESELAIGSTPPTVPPVHHPTNNHPVSDVDAPTVAIEPETVATSAAPWPASATTQLSTRIESLLPLVIWSWTLGVLLLSIRLAWSWRQIQVLKLSGTLVTQENVNSILDKLCKRLKMESTFVAIRESSTVHSPMVIGWLKPIVLLPISALTNLNQEQLSAILAHELAHIRRADYLINLFQTVIEILLFYHPAVWWLSHRIRQERENCCDDIAINVCQNKQQYVKALLQLEQSRSKTSELAMASDGGNLVNRVARVLGRTPIRNRQRGWTAGVVSALVMISILGISISGNSIAEESNDAHNLIQDQDDETENEPQDESVETKMRIQIIGPDKKPMSGVDIKVSAWYQRTAGTEDFKTNDDGFADVKMPDGLNTFRIWASAEGYTPLFANWESEHFNEGDLPPKEFTLQMIPAVEIGGLIVDENGRPIRGVSVEVKRNKDLLMEQEKRIKLGTWYAEGAAARITDENGRWTLNNIPPGDHIKLALKLSHHQYVSDEQWGELQTEQSIELKDLLSKDATIVMKRGIQIRGSITNEAGDPVNDALIIWGDNPYLQHGSQELKVEEDGTYETPTQKPGELRITVVAPGYAPQTEVVTVSRSMDPIDFSLEEGKQLEIQFVDDVGAPIPDVIVGIREWRGVSSLYNHRHPNVLDTRIPLRSDDLGIYQWDWAPEDKVTLAFYAEGYVEKSVELTATDDPITIVMNGPMRVTGTASDESGKPLKSFRVIPRRHSSPNYFREQRQSMVTGKDGKFSIDVENRTQTFSLRIEADGYQSAITDSFRGKPPSPPIEVTLKKSSDSQKRVVDEEGRAVNNATVVAAPIDQVVSLNGFDDRFSIQRAQNTASDQQGRFEFPNSNVPRTLLAFSEQGFVETAEYPNQPIEEIQLKRWASLQGIAMYEGKPAKLNSVVLPNRYVDGRYYHVQARISGTSLGDGTFEFPKVPAMPISLGFYQLQVVNGARCQVALEPKPGENIELDFSNSHQITGSVRFTGNDADQADLANSRYQLTRLDPSVKFPPDLVKEIQQNNLDISNFQQVFRFFEDQENWHATRAYESCFDKYHGPLSELGEFKVNVLRPGKYELRILAHPKTKEKNYTKPMSDSAQIIEITQPSTELGEVNAAVLDRPEPGSPVSDFTIQIRSDLSEMRLADLRGNYVLLDFWAPWSKECGQDNAKVQRLATVLAKKGKVKMVSIISSGSGPTERMPDTIPEGLTWISGKLDFKTERRVQRELAAWRPQHFALIDPDGNLVTEGSFANMVKKLSELQLK